MLSINKISFTIGGRTLFKSVSLDLKASDLLVIKGGNGSGKTSLLSILGGLTTSDTGSIFWKKFDISEDPHSYKKNLCYVGHNNAINGVQTVNENLKFWKEIYLSRVGLSRIIKLLKLSNVLDTPCHILSAGWKRRVALAKLLVSGKKLWIMDEPFSNMDNESRKMFSKIIKAHCKKGGIAIISCHGDEIVGNVTLKLGTKG